MQSQGSHDAIGLAVRLAASLSDRPLPADAEAKLKGDAPMSGSDRAVIGEAFQDAVRSPRITDAQRQRLKDLIQEVASVIRAPEPPREAEPPPPPVMPASSPAGTNETPELTSPRRWPIMVAAIVLLAGIGAASWLAWSNYRTGRDWQDRAVAAAADVERVGAENDTLEGDIADLEKALKRSEADVRLLERRLSRAANEKARVEDEREQVTAMAERIAEVAVAYDDVASWFSACREEQSNLTSMVFDFESYYLSGQTYLISSQIDRATNTCGTAEQQLADLRSYIASLSP